MFLVRVMTKDGILEREEDFFSEQKAMDYFDVMLDTYKRHGDYVIQLIDDSDNVTAEV